MIVLSRFRFLVLSLITNCLFLSVLLLSVAKEPNQPASCYYCIKITCNNKCYTKITMGVADYSKRQLKTIRFPFQEHRSKPHPSIMSSRELLISSPRCTCTDASDYARSLLCATLLIGSVAMQ